MSQLEQLQPVDNVVAAVKAARQYLQTLIPDVQGALLEEVEAPEASHEWKVTFSLPIAAGELGPFGAFAGPNTRKYKTVAIDADTGSFRSMRIREIRDRQ